MAYKEKTSLLLIICLFACTVFSQNKPTIKVFLENSGSMDGYVAGITAFENSIYNYLSAISNQNIANHQSYYYINSQKILFGNNLKDFIYNIEPSTFKKRGGNRKESDFPLILDSITRHLNANEISVFITDFVCSHSPQISSQEYLARLATEIRNSISRKLNSQPNFAVVIYQLASEFTGTYYYIGGKQQIKHIRPFYICLLGDKKALISLANKVEPSAYQNKISFSSKEKNLDYCIVTTHKVGTLERKNCSTLSSAKGDKSKRLFMFAIGLNFDNLLVDESYFATPSNYSISNNQYSLQINKLQNTTGKYKYLLQLKKNSPIVTTTNLSIALLRKTPTWVNTLSESQGGPLNTKNMLKTYGLASIIKGINEAYSEDDSCIFNFNIKIN